MILDTQAIYRICTRFCSGVWRAFKYFFIQTDHMARINSVSRT